jgi:hypothetical protein
MRGRPPKYPWDEWLDGELKFLRRGEDFDPERTGRPSAASFRATAYKAAEVRGGKAEARLQDENLVLLRFIND